MDRRLKMFVGRQIDHLLEAAKDCRDDTELHADILAMAEDWMLQSLENGGIRGIPPERPLDVAQKLCPPRSRGPARGRTRLSWRAKL